MVTFVKKWHLEYQMVTRTYLTTYLWDSSDISDSCDWNDSSDSIYSSDSIDISDSSDNSDSSDRSKKNQFPRFFLFLKLLQNSKTQIVTVVIVTIVSVALVAVVIVTPEGSFLWYSQCFKENRMV